MTNYTSLRDRLLSHIEYDFLNHTSSLSYDAFTNKKDYKVEHDLKNHQFFEIIITSWIIVHNL